MIIPSFAVGRTQELVFDLNQMVAEGQIEPVPVYVDGPLAVNTTDVFRRHPECFDQETREFVRENRHPALEFKGLTYVCSVEEIQGPERPPRANDYRVGLGNGGDRPHSASPQ